MKVYSSTKKIELSIDPIEVFNKIRKVYKDSMLLEIDNSKIYIGFKAIGMFKVIGNAIILMHPHSTEIIKKDINSILSITDELKNYIDSYTFIYNGEIENKQRLFGYCSYESVQYFEQIRLTSTSKNIHSIPEIYYNFFKYIAEFDLKGDNTCNFTVNSSVPLSEEYDSIIHKILFDKKLSEEPFSLIGSETSNLTDIEFIDMVQRGKDNCQKGNVFQIVLSRQFSQAFIGDNFKVYKALRKINPSPYMYYFNYEDFEIFGASPESQIKFQNNEAIINPIAGTFLKSQDDKENKKIAKALLNDLKENAEHIMLVDLARNDLSRNSNSVVVKKYREVHQYSHVMHLVSEVVGTITYINNYIHILADTFPAGTLSGAPKYKAMQLIDQIENQARGAYGGCIGYITFSKELNHAIMIRTIISKDHHLYYQAGAGIVSKSNKEAELQEVNNKLAAIRASINRAINVNQ